MGEGSAQRWWINDLDYEGDRTASLAAVDGWEREALTIVAAAGVSEACAVANRLGDEEEAALAAFLDHPTQTMGGLLAKLRLCREQDMRPEVLDAATRDAARLSGVAV